MKILKRLGYLIIFTLLAIIAGIAGMLYAVLHPITKAVAFIFFGKLIDWFDVISDIIDTILCNSLDWYCQKTNTYDYFDITN